MPTRADKVVKLLEQPRFKAVKDHVPVLLLILFLEAWDMLKESEHA